MINKPDRERAEIIQSPLAEAYKLLDATTPLELSQKYTLIDQELADKRTWDYDNPALLTNKVKNVLEKVDLDQLQIDERDWSREILWFWYHHAISCAVFNKKDKAKAITFAEKALQYQGLDHPNKITLLLSFLVSDNLNAAKEWALSIDEEPEKSTAQDLITSYEKGVWFK